MNVIVNGQPLSLEEPATVRAIVERFGMGNAACAVEVNRQVVPRKQHEQRQVHDGDQIEIVTLVGGG